jgi:methionine-rich copper-binding protein CopC
VELPIRFKNVGILIWVALLVAVPLAAPAAAERAIAPEYQSSEPADGATVHEPPDRVSATFSEPLDPSSDMLIHDECGRRIDDRDLQFNINEMSVGLAEKPSGVYHVAYEATGLGGVTGTTKGSFEFTVHGGASCSGSGGHQHGGGGGGHHGGGGGHHGGGGGGHEGDEHEGDEHAHSSDSDHGHDVLAHDDHGDPTTGHGGSGHDHRGGSDAREPGANKVLAKGADPEPPIAAPPIPAPTTATGAIALIAFSLAGAFGLVGGWLLRQIH